MSRFLSDRGYLTGKVPHSTKLEAQAFPIQLDAEQHVGATVVIGDGSLFYSNGNEWVGFAPEASEIMIPPWGDIPDGWFRTGVIVSTSAGDREVITSRFDLNYVSEKIVARYTPAANALWTTVDQSVLVTSDGDPVGFAPDTTGAAPNIPALQPVSADRPIFRVGPPAAFDFSGFADRFLLDFSGGYSGTLMVVNEWGVYTCGYSASGQIQFGDKKTALHNDIIFFSEALSSIEIDGLITNLIEENNYVQDNFAARTDWSFAFSQMDYLITAPAVDMSSATNVESVFAFCTNLQSIPQYDWSNVTDAIDALRGCYSLGAFPPIQMPLCTQFIRTWSVCSAMTSFPALNMDAAASVRQAWFICSGLTAFPAIDFPACIDFGGAWSDTNFPTFPNVDVSAGQDFSQAWKRSGLTSFPALNFSAAAADFMRAWSDSNELQSFPPNVFDNATATNYLQAFGGCRLNQNSVDNILVSIAASASDGALVNGTLGIAEGETSTGSNAAPSSVGEAAIDSLRAAGWTVTVNGGY